MTGRRENLNHSIIAQHHCLIAAFIAFNYCVLLERLSSSGFGEVAPQNSRFSNQPDLIELICSSHQWGVPSVGTAVMVWQEKGVIDLFAVKQKVK